MESAFGSSSAAPAQFSQAPAQQQPVQQPAANPAPQSTSNDDFGEFPSMFGSTPDGFGNFKGFESDAFGSSNQDTFGQPAAPAQPSASAQPKQEKKDDWFEF